MGAHLDLADLRAVNGERVLLWHDDRFGVGSWIGDGRDWTGADWSNAMCGEAGEAANVVKKIRRQETAHLGAVDPELSVLRPRLAEELADTLIYADLLAAHYGIDLAQAVKDKFNAISAREGFPQRLS